MRYPIDLHEAPGIEPIRIIFCSIPSSMLSLTVSCIYSSERMSMSSCGTLIRNVFLYSLSTTVKKFVKIMVMVRSLPKITNAFSFSSALKLIQVSLAWSSPT